MKGPGSSIFADEGQKSPEPEEKVGALGFSGASTHWLTPRNAPKFVRLLLSDLQWGIEQRKLREQIERGDLVVISDSSQVSMEVRP